MSNSRPKDICGSLDVRLMRILLVLLNENSVSRAAHILGQTQPTISAALKRLREMSGDPLLVRSGSRLAPTERALEIRRVVAKALDEIDASFAGPAAFDPQSTERRFHILAANSLGPLLLPRLLKRIVEAAPHATLEISTTPEPGEMIERFRRGDLDLAITSDSLHPEEMRVAPLLSTDTVCLVGREHPLAEAQSVSLERYLMYDHITPTRGPLGSLGPIDAMLLALGRERRIAFWPHEFGVIPFVLLETRLVFTTGRYFAEHLASSLPLAVVRGPPEFGPMKFHMLWHERQHRSPANRWLRDLVRGVTQEIGRRPRSLIAYPA